MKATASMIKKVKAGGAKVETVRKVQKPKPAPVAKPTPKSADTDALERRVAELSAELTEMRKAAVTSSQEVIEALSKRSETEPLRLKPIRDMDRNSPTYLLVKYYDFIPVAYRKLDS